VIKKAKTKEKKPKRPSVGVGVLVVKDKKILLSRRLKAYGFGKLALPGGHVEWMESLKVTAKREVLEETGIKLGRIHNLYVYSEEVHPKNGKHYVTFYLIAKCPKNQEPRDMEPHKHGPWGWYDPFNLPKSTWRPTKRLCSTELKGGCGTLIRAFINEEGLKL
jgi:8-oxo-dGTP diphosphatase